MEVDNNGMYLGASDHNDKGGGQGYKDDASDEGDGESMNHDLGDAEGTALLHRPPRWPFCRALWCAGSSSRAKRFKVCLVCYTGSFFTRL